MAAPPRHRPFTGFHIFLFLLFIGRRVEAQSPSNENTSNKNFGPTISANFNPSMVIIIVALVSAFFLLGFFSFYIRHCGNGSNDSYATPANAAAATDGRIRIKRGLDPTTLENFPTLVYSEVKEHKIGKGALECAICLNEFEDDETIRLLPECDHVFHLECIDAWLDTHVTCPVCRTNYTFYSPDPTSKVTARNEGEIPAAVPPEAVVFSDASPADHAAITVGDMEKRKNEMRELARIASKARGNGAKRSKRILRYHSTGHSMMPQGEASLDRYTLRLPDNVRKEIIAAGKLQRARTFAVTMTVGGAGGASMKKVSRGAGEGSIRMGQTVRLGRSDRWPSFFGRSLSGKKSTLGNRWRGEGEYVKEKSMSRRLSVVKTAVESRGASAAGGGSKNDGCDYSDEASTAGVNRV